MSLDEEVNKFASDIVSHSSVINAELLRARSGQLSIAEYAECKRRMVRALGEIKTVVLRSMQAGAYGKLAAELDRRGYGVKP